ncbi:histidine phosphatase superfamily [Mycena latifolia]|nr:histidine phosphatase superfamily [Mycena latifolia]
MSTSCGLEFFLCVMISCSHDLYFDLGLGALWSPSVNTLYPFPRLFSAPHLAHISLNPGLLIFATPDLAHVPYDPGMLTILDLSQEADLRYYFTQECISPFVYIVLIYVTSASAGVASSFAGSTTTALFPPENVTITVTDTFFPDASEVGYGGSTPSARSFYQRCKEKYHAAGDEAAAIATAPAVALVDSVFPLIKPDTSDKKPGFDVLQHLGSLSPFQSVESLGLPDASARVPEGCKITEVRTPSPSPRSFAAAVHAAATGAGFNASGPLEFLNTWTYKLGAETLTPFERVFNVGMGFRMKYDELLKEAKDLPVFRTTSEARMVYSALNFAAGFFGVQSYQNDYHQLIELDGDIIINSTLAPWNCPILDTDVAAYGSDQAAKWAQTVALGYSAFRDLFTGEEWKGFSYFFGPGRSRILVQLWPGCAVRQRNGHQELVSRLTRTRIIEFDTTVNGSIVSSPVTFPFGQPIYVDATHDTVISAIITALNFTTLAANGMTHSVTCSCSAENGCWMRFSHNF